MSDETGSPTDEFDPTKDPDATVRSCKADDTFDPTADPDATTHVFSGLSPFDDDDFDPRDYEDFYDEHGGDEDSAPVANPLKPRKRSQVAPKRRFKVLRRDKFRCRLCGRDAKDDVRLVVDHIIPVSKGGSNEYENLWTLCDECNMGKSAMDLEEPSGS